MKIVKAAEKTYNGESDREEEACTYSKTKLRYRRKT